MNCNLQRLDGPVRGNGKIVQELEGIFAALAGMSSSSCGAPPGSLLAKDNPGLLAKAHGGMCRRGVPGLQIEKWRVCTRTVFRQVPRTLGMVKHGPTTIFGGLSRWQRSPQGVRRVRRGRESWGPADRDPCQNRQGLRNGRGRRRAEHHPSTEEDGHEALSKFRDRFLDPVSLPIREMPFLTWTKTPRK